MLKEIGRSSRSAMRQAIFILLMGMIGFLYSLPANAQTAAVTRKFDYADDRYLSGVAYAGDVPLRAFRRFTPPSTENGLTAYFTAWDSPVVFGSHSLVSLDMYYASPLPYLSDKTGISVGLRPDREYSLQAGLDASVPIARYCELNFNTPGNYKGTSPYTVCNNFDFKVIWGGAGYFRNSPPPTSPDISDVNPAHGSTIASWPKIGLNGAIYDVVEGYAKDLNGSGVSSVYLVLKRDSDGAFWNGTNWSYNKDKLDCSVSVSNRTYSGFPYYFFRRLGGLPVGANLLNGTYTLIVNAKDGKSQLTEYTSKIRVLHP